MSAYMIDRDHITYLLNAATRCHVSHYGPLSWRHAGTTHELSAGDNKRALEVGQMLWDENRKSIEARYPDTKEDFCKNAPGPSDETYVYDSYDDRAFSRLESVQVLKALHCYEYQSCEHKGWADSEAKAFTTALEGRVIRTLPGYAEAKRGAPNRT